MRQIVMSYYFECDYVNAAEAARRLVARYPGVSGNHRWLAMALGQLGRTEEARVALRRALDVPPGSFAFYTRHLPPWLRPEDYEHMLEGMRKAGWLG